MIELEICARMLASCARLLLYMLIFYHVVEKYQCIVYVL